MQRKAWTGVLLTLMFGGFMYVSFVGQDEGDGGSNEMGRIEGVSSAEGALGGGEARAGAGSVRRPPPTSGDAGVWGAAQPNGRRPNEHQANGTQPDGPQPSRPTNARGELQRSADGDARSAGWRLGRARARIELIQPRIARMQELATELEASGDSDAAERQRAVLARFERRLEELRTEEGELAAEAERDGTLGEVEVGMRESEDLAQPERAPVRAQ